jgi:MATE family multidrug resistance protein
MIKQFKQYAKELLGIALPIIMGNLGFILIGAGDVLIAGRHSTQTLAAISIATAILNCIFMIGIGLIMSITPILSNTRGEGADASKYFYPTLRFAACASAAIMFIIWAIVPAIDLLGFDPQLTPVIKEFMMITSYGSFFVFLHGALKEFLQAHENVFVPNLITVIAVFLNVGLCAALVFGWGVFHEMGVPGIAIASLIVRGLMALALLIYCFKIMTFKNYVDWDYYKNIFKIGMPIALAILIEFVTFNIVAVIMGRVSGVYAAAQNLVTTVSSISFMIPLAISNAIAVKVGFANGSHNFEDLKKYSIAGIIMSLGFMACSAAVMSAAPGLIVSIFTADNELIRISVPMMILLAAFQIFDGLQVSLSGIFKGIKKTTVVMTANLFAYWFVALPLGYVLAFKYNYGIIGFWYGLFAAGILLCTIMITYLAKDMKRR